MNTPNLSLSISAERTTLVLDGTPVAEVFPAQRDAVLAFLMSSKTKTISTPAKAEVTPKKKAKKPSHRKVTSLRFGTNNYTVLMALASAAQPLRLNQIIPSNMNGNTGKTTVYNLLVSGLVSKDETALRQKGRPGRTPSLYSITPAGRAMLDAALAQARANVNPAPQAPPVA